MTSRQEKQPLEFHRSTRMRRGGRVLGALALPLLLWTTACSDAIVGPAPADESGGAAPALRPADGPRRNSASWCETANGGLLTPALASVYTGTVTRFTVEINMFGGKSWHLTRPGEGYGISNSNSVATIVASGTGPGTHEYWADVRADASGSTMVHLYINGNGYTILCGTLSVKPDVGQAFISGPQDVEDGVSATWSIDWSERKYQVPLASCRWDVDGVTFQSDGCTFTHTFFGSLVYHRLEAYVVDANGNTAYPAITVNVHAPGPMYDF